MSDAVESYVMFATEDTGEALTEVENALRHAHGLTRERLIRAHSALKEAAAHLDTVYASDLHSVKA